MRYSDVDDTLILLALSGLILASNESGNEWATGNLGVSCLGLVFISQWLWMAVLASRLLLCTSTCLEFCLQRNDTASIQQKHIPGKMYVGTWDGLNEHEVYGSVVKVQNNSSTNLVTDSIPDSFVIHTLRKGVLL